MNRISLGNGAWFDLDAAQEYEESTRFDGHNRISSATGSQWNHECLYKTAKGRWVLHSWSQWQGSRPTYEVVDEASAHEWLIAHGHADDVPAEDVAAAEI